VLKPNVKWDKLLINYNFFTNISIKFIKMLVWQVYKIVDSVDGHIHRFYIHNRMQSIKFRTSMNGSRQLRSKAVEKLCVYCGLLWVYWWVPSPVAAEFNGCIPSKCSNLAQGTKFFFFFTSYHPIIAIICPNFEVCHLQDTLRMEATMQHYVQNTVILTFTTMRTSNLNGFLVSRFFVHILHQLQKWWERRGRR
jgi:hypothetical protein